MINVAKCQSVSGVFSDLKSLCEKPYIPEPVVRTASYQSSGGLAARVEALELEVATLKQEIGSLVLTVLEETRDLLPGHGMNTSLWPPLETSCFKGSWKQIPYFKPARQSCD